MTDLFLQAWTALAIEWAKLDHVFGKPRDWRPGQPLKLLFAGYNGARNTGSDVRVEEMIRQIRRILGPDRVRFSVLTQDPSLTRGYFGDAEQIRLEDVFPPFLHRIVPQHHGVVACEGSMFKSKFADALSTMMAGALGIASARNGLSVGYGAEAGAMTAPLQKLVQRSCKSSLVLARNEESERVLRRLGIPVEPGTDTAWTFESLPPSFAESKLREAGWDGRAPILAICPIHPFWWPVKASLTKAAANALFGAFAASRYRSVYFHTSSRRVESAFRNYLSAIAGGVESFRARRRVFPILVAMERLDTLACDRLSTLLGRVPVFSSRTYDMYELVSILRASHFLLSSRYHGIVTTMPALIPSAGITMDERIRNLLEERGHQELSLEASDPNLEVKVDHVLERLWVERDEIRLGIGLSVVRNLHRMAAMGSAFEQEVARRFPDFPTRSGIVSWEEYLPPLSPQLLHLVDEFGPAASEESELVPGSLTASSAR